MKLVKQYGFIFRIIGAALLVGLALFLEFGDGERIVIPFVGSLIILYSVIRLVPFIRTQRNDLIKTINIMEITITIVIGIIMIVGAIVVKDVEGVFSDIFGYMFGAVLIGRSAVHFYSLSYGVEKGDNISYLFHILALPAGTIAITMKDFDGAVLIHIILLFSVLTGGYLGYGGYKGYQVYRIEKTMDVNITSKTEKNINDQIVPEIEEPAQDHVN